MADSDVVYTVVFKSEFNTNITNSLDPLFYFKKCTIFYLLNGKAWELTNIYTIMLGTYP
jgi:hypothetical protein